MASQGDFQLVKALANPDAKFCPWDPQGRRTELTLVSCPLTCAHTVMCAHVNIHTHTPGYNMVAEVTEDVEYLYLDSTQIQQSFLEAPF